MPVSNNFLNTGTIGTWTSRAGSPGPPSRSRRSPGPCWVSLRRC